MLVKTALSQVGYKEGRNNDNKYGKWMGVNNQRGVLALSAGVLVTLKENR